MSLNPGDNAPDFTLPTDSNGDFTLSKYRGKNVVIYFYPKDNTPGCTIEANEFTAYGKEFEAVNTIVVGISKDSVKKHAQFRAKHNLSVLLAADEDGVALDLYGVWGKKLLYGRTFLGIERATFLVDTQGKIHQTWRNVKVKGHVEAVLSAAKELNARQ